MEDLLIEILESFGYPVQLQGSLLSNEPYPDHFFTFWNNSSYSKRFYDNDEKSIVYDYDVNAVSYTHLYHLTYDGFKLCIWCTGYAK